VVAVEVTEHCLFQVKAAGPVVVETLLAPLVQALPGRVIMEEVVKMLAVVEGVVPLRLGRTVTARPPVTEVMDLLLTPLGV
jgi:hypothetical protein